MTNLGVIMLNRGITFHLGREEKEQLEHNEDNYLKKCGVEKTGCSKFLNSKLVEIASLTVAIMSFWIQQTIKPKINLDSISLHLLMQV